MAGGKLGPETTPGPGIDANGEIPDVEKRMAHAILGSRMPNALVRCAVLTDVTSESRAVREIR